jgi:16S rRNA G966 N2-methylase RsmD
MLDRTQQVVPTGTEVRAIADIKVGNRHRKDLGDIARFAQNLADLGHMLHPVVVNSNDELVAGYRRLAAAKAAGWDKVPVTVIDLPSIVAGEFAENACRKNFLPSEIDAIRRTLEPLEQAAARARQLAGLRRGRQQSDPVPESFRHGETRNKVAAYVGVSGRTLDKVREVCAAAEAEERFAPLVAEMDRTGKVHRPYAELRRIRAEESEALPSTGHGSNAQIIRGDFREQGHAVADNSVDLIFTDPPYRRQDVQQFGALAQFAARVLVEGGSLITYFGNRMLPEVLQLMTPHLDYHWLCTVSITGGKTNLPGKSVGVQIGHKPLLWFTKGTRRTSTSVADHIKSERGNKSQHPWAQGETEATHFIKYLSRNGSLIVDPFCGSATTGVAALKGGRCFIGFEIDPETARKAKARIARLRGEGE